MVSDTLRYKLHRLFSFTAVALLALVVLAACGGGEGDEATDDVPREEVAGAPDFPIANNVPNPGAGGTPAATGGGAASQPPATGGGAPSTAITLAAASIQWDQTALTIPANTPVAITLVNNDPIAHNFVVEGQVDAVDMPANQTVETEVNLPAGEYVFVCTIPGHEAIMRGTLTVTEGAQAPSDADSAAANAPTAPAPAGAAPAAGGANAITLAAAAIQWDQTALTMPAGTDVTITLVNNDPIAHNFVVEGQTEPVDMPASVTVTTTLNLPAGEYVFVCTIPGHEAIMRGTLTVQ